MTFRPAEVRDIMSRQVITVSEDDTVEFVINLFERQRISGALVMNDEGCYTGVISKTDLSGRRVLDWVNQDLHLDAMLVREVMGRHRPITVGENVLVTDAVKTMREQHIHRVFVEGEGGQIVGVVSSMDVLKIIDADEDPLEVIRREREAEKLSKTPEEDAPSQSASPEENALEERITQLILKKQKEVIAGGD